MKSKIIVIVGPTGVGKTSLSLSLAKNYNAEIINIDAMQIYKEMNIGTAKIMDTKGIPHHLLSIRSVSEPYSVYEYQKDARKILDEFIKNNKNVIIVGGSGLYVKALLYDYKFDVENDNNQYDNLSNEDIYTEIKELNNEVDIHINNRKRLVRMLNKLKNNNKLDNNGDTLLYDNVYFIGLSTDRTTLYKRIDERVDEMVKEGLIEEVKSLYDKNINTIPINTAIGYKELYKYFDSKISKEDAIDLIKKNSRHYAKRQYTWFNNKMNIKWFDVDFNNFENTIKEVIKYID
ncbi:tRNA dimethylallyltransferase [Clostridium sp. CAG:1193]|mgnify:FL=1|nr:tRNA dimethylallyltransferase [Clostridium sp. CAG:1193]